MHGQDMVHEADVDVWMCGFVVQGMHLFGVDSVWIHGHGGPAALRTYSSRPASTSNAVQGPCHAPLSLSTLSLSLCLSPHLSSRPRHDASLTLAGAHYYYYYYYYY